ncbi:hypothetical protein C7E18_01715 [Stenotrophomonas maltophilia]|nr:hypothetical protein C7E18_01715 [Stenotrophomonas maltophilia]
MRNSVSVCGRVRVFGVAMAGPLARLLPACSLPRQRIDLDGRNRDAGSRHHPATVVNLRDVVSQRKQRSAVAMTGPDADLSIGVLTVPGRKPRQRV